jgi:hypothetical protein
MSTQYFSGLLDGRSQVAVALADAVAPPNLRIAIVLERSNARSAPIWIDDLAAEQPAAVDAAGYDRAIAILVNVATSGSSVRPTLCMGTPEEVVRCRFPDATDAGAPAPDGGALPADDGEPTCGCTATASHGVACPVLALAVLMLWRWRSRR